MLTLDYFFIFFFPTMSTKFNRLDPIQTSLPSPNTSHPVIGIANFIAIAFRIITIASQSAMSISLNQSSKAMSSFCLWNILTSHKQHKQQHKIKEGIAQAIQLAAIDWDWQAGIAYRHHVSLLYFYSAAGRSYFCFFGSAWPHRNELRNVDRHSSTLWVIWVNEKKKKKEGNVFELIWFIFVAIRHRYSAAKWKEKEK